MSLTLTARLSTRLHGLVQLVARHTRHRRPRVGTWHCTVASVAAGCDQSRPRNVCSRYTNTTWTPRTTTSIDHLLNWILLPKVTDVVVVKNIWEDEDDDNGLWMTAAARDKGSFCWRPWSGCCWGWSPPASPGGKAGKGWAGREAGGWGL